jgi:oligopeptide transport system substrate-binding protein
MNRSVGKTISMGLLAALLFSAMSCARVDSGAYFGRTVPPDDNILRYVSGSEPESFDPHISSGQPEARIYMALFDGLVEYDPKTLLPIPAIAKSWEISSNVDVLVFKLRDNAKWSDGTPINAHDFVYSFRRGFDAETLSRTASLGYFIRYSEDFNSGHVFVKKDGRFLLEHEVNGTEPHTVTPFGPETEFAAFINGPTRLTLPGDEKERSKLLEKDEKLRTAVDGAEFVPVKAEDIGVEAVDDMTLRLTLRQSAPFFLGLLAHQFFRPVPRHVVEKYGSDWTKPENIVTNGAFKVKHHRPYDELFVIKNENYWDAENVHLDGIKFYPIDENATILNLYKGGAIDAFLNHSVPASWIDEVRQYKDEYLDHPENATAYYSMNMTKPPFDDVRVRRAFQMSVDREALSNYRKVTKPLYDLTPAGIFPDYDKARAKVSEELRIEKKKTPEEWAKYNRFDPAEARRLLGEAGFPVEGSEGNFICPKFPTDSVSLTFNTNENNRMVAEFIQAQWKRHLGITISLKSQEFRTFLKDRNDLQYSGLAQSLWSGDYMDPFTFLGLHYGRQNDGGSGFADKEYDRMLDEANSELDFQKRYEKLARAEAYVMDKLPVVTLSIYATNWLKKPYVKGMYPNPGTLHPWKFVYIEKDPAKWDRNVDNIMAESNPRTAAQLEELKRTMTQN